MLYFKRQLFDDVFNREHLLNLTNLRVINIDNILKRFGVDEV